MYEVFITTLPTDGFLVEDVLNLYHGRGAFEVVLADEDVEEDEGLAGVPTPSADKNSGKSRGSRVWNLRLALGQETQAGTSREIEWAAPKEAPSLFSAAENTAEEYGPWQWARPFGGATGLIAGGVLYLCRDNGMLRCPAGANLNLGRSASRKCLYAAGRLCGLPDGLSVL